MVGYDALILIKRDFAFNDLGVGSVSESAEYSSAGDLFIFTGVMVADDDFFNSLIAADIFDCAVEMKCYIWSVFRPLNHHC